MRSTLSSEFCLSRIWRNEGTTSRYYYGIGQVQGDQLVAREFYLAMLAMDEHV